MATADKLAKLSATKADLKAALTEKGMNPGNEFDTYPNLVRAIATGAEWEIITTSSSVGATVSSSLAGITHCYGSTNNSGFMTSAGAVGLCDNTLYWVSKSGSNQSPTYTGRTAQVSFNGGTISSNGSNFRNMSLLFLYDENGG